MQPDNYRVNAGVTLPFAKNGHDRARLLASRLAISSYPHSNPFV